jgi:hypothetical protein
VWINGETFGTPQLLTVASHNDWSVAHSVSAVYINYELQWTMCLVTLLQTVVLFNCKPTTNEQRLFSSVWKIFV